MEGGCVSVQSLELLCKLLACTVVLVSASFHFYRLFQYKHTGDTCPLLFESGHWVGKQWQPEGCMMHSYSVSEMRICLGNGKVAFIGDSRMRNLYFELADAVSQEPVPTGKFHEDLKYRDKSNTTIEFYWHPELSEQTEQLLNFWMQKPTKMPDLIIMGVGTWTIKKNLPYHSVDFHEKLNSISGIVGRIGRNLTRSKRNKRFMSRFHHEPQIIWIQQDPVVEDKLSESRKAITNKQIDIFNYAAQKIFLRTGFVRILKSTTQMAAGMPEETKDGLHYSSFILRRKVDTILNGYCNDFIYPDDASCCKDPERITKLQSNAFAVLGTCVLLWILMWIVRFVRSRRLKGLTEDEIVEMDKRSAAPWLYSDSMYKGMRAMTKLTFIMIYIFLADSSFLYNKTHKQYSPITFSISLALMLVLGLATKTKSQSEEFLNDKQVNEFKGWLILFLMIYNYTGADQMLPAFVNSRLVFSFFLFLLGFVHFKQFWYTENFQFIHAGKIIAHVNVFCVCVCLTMGHVYQYYTLVPQLTLWYFAVYLVMLMCPRSSHKIVQEQPIANVWMLAKFFVILTLIYIIWANETVSDWLFTQTALRELFIGTDGTIHQWKYHSSLHKYAVVFGMMVSYGYVTLKEAGIVEDSKYRVLFTDYKLSIGVSAASILAFIIYEVYAFTCHSKISYDQTHAVVCLAPLVSLVLLRNMPGCLRSHYSAFFAWIGEMSIELFIAHFHIWLANDSHGIHMLVPGHVTINLVVTSFTLVCIVHEVKKVCVVLADLLVHTNIMVMLRRTLVFIVMMLVIWWHKTHEVKPHTFRHAMNYVQ